MTDLSLDQISNTELSMIVMGLEACGKARSINQKWTLSALQELQRFRAGEFICLSCSLRSTRGEPVNAEF